MDQNSLLLIILNMFASSESTDIMIMKQMISQFPNHSLMFHFDNNTDILIDTIAASVENRNIYLMNNYDYIETTGKFATIPDGFVFLHFVLLQNYARLNLYTGTSPFSLSRGDVLLFIMQSRNDFVFWERNRLEKAGGLFVFDPWKRLLYTACFFCGNLTATLRKVDGVRIHEDNGTINIPALEKFINNYDDFNKHVLRVAYIAFEPYFFGNAVNDNNTHTVYEGEGFDRDLLVTISEKLNFECVMVSYNMYYNHYWLESVNSIGRGEIEIAVSGLLFAYNHYKMIYDHTTTIDSIPISVLYSLYEDPWMSWKYILMPFESYVWLLLLGTISVFSFLLSKTLVGLSMLSFINGWFRLLLDQSLTSFEKLMKRPLSILILITLWLSMASVLNNSYKCRLTSSLINSKAIEFDSVEELLDKGYIFYINPSFLLYDLRHSEDPTYTALARNSLATYTQKYDRDFLSTTGQKHAMVDSYRELQVKLYEYNKNGKISIDDSEKMRLIPEDITSAKVAWYVRSNCPFKQRFNKIFSWLHATGILVKLMQNHTPIQMEIPRSHQQITREARKLTLSTMTGPAIVWMTGMSIATLVFIGKQWIARVLPSSRQQTRSPNIP